MLLHQRFIVLDYTKEKDEQATEVTEEQCIAFFFYSLLKVDIQSYVIIISIVTIYY